MEPSSRDRISVDLHGLKAALVARAQAQRVSVSVLVRAAVAREQGLGDVGASASGSAGMRFADSVESQAPNQRSTVKLSIRLSSEEARQLASGAQAAGLSRGAYLAGLLAGVPVLLGTASASEEGCVSEGRAMASPADHLAQLTTSNAELALLGRSLHQLATLLRRNDMAAAWPYRALLETLARDVRQHLDHASHALSDLQPRRGTAKHMGGTAASRWALTSQKPVRLRPPSPATARQALGVEPHGEENNTKKLHIEEVRRNWGGIRP